MIIADLDDGRQFVTQPAHAELAGWFADHWGSSMFDEPPHPAALRLAAYNHDNGWGSYDRQPHLADGKLVDFRTPPPATWIDLYEAGIDEVVELDRYAGLLTSMHGAGLRRHRYGLSPDWPAPGSTFAEFVDREEARQSTLAEALLEDTADDRVTSRDLELLSALHADGTPGPFADTTLWFAYRLLQTWDVLSLAFCVTPEPPGYGPVDTPRAPGDDGIPVRITHRGNHRYELDPYPLSTAPVQAWISRRRVSDRTLETATSPTEAYYSADRELFRFTLDSPES